MRKFELINTPLFGATVAACTVFVTQFMWWGSVFNDSWPGLNGLTEADLEVPQSWWVVGFALITAQVVGIAQLLHTHGWPTVPKVLGHVTKASLTFALPIVGYRLVYLPEHSWKLFAIDAASIVIGWTLSAIILTLFKYRPAPIEVGSSATAPAMAST